MNQQIMFLQQLQLCSASRKRQSVLCCVYWALMAQRCSSITLRGITHGQARLERCESSLFILSHLIDPGHESSPQTDDTVQADRDHSLGAKDVLYLNLRRAYTHSSTHTPPHSCMLTHTQLYNSPTYRMQSRNSLPSREMPVKQKHRLTAGAAPR